MSSALLAPVPSTWKSLVEGGWPDDAVGVEPPVTLAWGPPKKVSGSSHSVFTGVDNCRLGNNVGMDYEAITARLAKASPAPWRRHGADVYATNDLDGPILVSRTGVPEIRQQSDADADFVAHARTDLGELLRVGGKGRAQSQPHASACEYKFVTHSEQAGTDSELNTAGAPRWRFVAVVPEKAGHVLLLLERSHV